ncbi:hypothetical protein PPL_05297 [Heterostelium album PN500]|uniref:3-oxo-5-alpha-steroid 4-dehydrogenase C-terminal domain-containing protein n=1 Tax=Heterostelium pallidum (strain ATCC 26659 / Pp 5 / PN500) TaxID=670386 RepID=D3BBB0_HETP5|nr:hypothetical protein PPL_05297 [Heterostelium album PN500]EFA81317.1 hypothetical protein PPL_05297 [Heterostelium album PN500]|eukprot:XP_020433435.1 hypothetical protein PPL_05297 [Heterostelium album PN500]
MIFINDLTTEILNVCITYWYVAIAIYLLRVVSSSFNSFTSYGKLDSNRLNNSNNNQPQQQQNINNRSILSALYLDYQLFETKYGWFLFYLTAFSSAMSLLGIVYLLDLYNNINYHNVIFLIIFYCMIMFQSIRRMYETIEIQVHSFSMMNVLLFVSGISYYIMATVSPLAEFIARLEFKYIEPQLDYDNQEYDDNEINNMYKLIIVVFLVASLLQQRIHKQLAAIRKSSTTSTNNSNNTINDNSKPYYEIPKGGLFNLVSCPHFLMEIIIYFCFVALSNFKSKTLCLNLIHRALESHNWYKKTFKSTYPSNRKAIIPFLFLNKDKDVCT